MNGKIIDYLGENKFVIQLPEEEEWNYTSKPETIQIAHDYVRFIGQSHIEMEHDGKGNYPYIPKSGASNLVRIESEVTISIREMIEVVLPLLKNHKYLQKEHICDRVKLEDDKYFEQLGLKEPRWKKGDSYPGYAYQDGVIKYYDEDQKIWMIKFRRRNSKIYETVSVSTFNEIKDSLFLFIEKESVEYFKSITKKV